MENAVVVNFFWLLCVTTCGALHCGEENSCSEAAETRPESGRSLLQVKPSNTEAKLLNPITALTEQEPALTEETFRGAADTCCNYQMDMYIRRVLDEMGFEICDEGCHNGFTPFFSCDAERTLENLRLEIDKISKTECACYGPAGQCSPLADICPRGEYNPSYHRRRACSDAAQPATPRRRRAPAPFDPSPAEGEIEIVGPSPAEGETEIVMTPRRRRLAGPVDPAPPRRRRAPVPTPRRRRQPGPIVDPQPPRRRRAPVTAPRRRRAPVTAPRRRRAPVTAPRRRRAPELSASKDIVVAIDASKSVEESGWAAQSAFGQELLRGLAGNGQHGLSVHYFNAETHPVSGSSALIGIRDAVQSRSNATWESFFAEQLHENTASSSKSTWESFFAEKFREKAVSNSSLLAAKDSWERHFGEQFLTRWNAVGASNLGKQLVTQIGSAAAEHGSSNSSHKDSVTNILGAAYDDFKNGRRYGKGFILSEDTAASAFKNKDKKKGAAEQQETNPADPIEMITYEQSPIEMITHEQSPTGTGFEFDGEALANGLAALKYSNIREGSTDHPQVYMTAESIFQKFGRTGKDKVLIMLTDGETHKGYGCKKLDKAAVEAKVGKCTSGSNHVCAPRGCNMEKCMCGMYTSELFKDKGYRLIIVGVANKNHVGETEAGVFRAMMEHRSSPNSFFYAPDFADLPNVLPQVLAAV